MNTSDRHTFPTGSAAAEPPPASAAPSAEALRVLLLVADAARVLHLGRLLRLRWPACRIEEESDPVDALLKAVRMPADLVLVDAALSLGPPGVLARHLGRVAPAVSMLVFAEQPATEERPLVSCWSEVAAQIDRWAGERPPALQRRGAA